MTRRSQRVFISYTKSDEDFVAQVSSLIRENGFDVWFALNRLTGSDRLSTIADHIAAADFAIVVLSKSAVNSEWVKHEMNNALAHCLDHGKPKVIPVFIEDAPRPAAIADLVSVSIDRRNADTGIGELLAVLKGLPYERGNRLADFRVFVNHLVELPDEQFGFCDDISRLNMTSSLIDVRSRMRTSLEQHLEKAKRNAEDKSRILDAFENRVQLPIITFNARNEINNWIRMADSELLWLSGKLWECHESDRYLRGITVEWCEEALRLVTPQTQSHDQIALRARILCKRAYESGLLADSTEYNDSRTYAYLDANTNSSYDFGPFFWSVCRYSAFFADSGQL